MDSTNTNSMMHDKAKQEPKMCVRWDINSCPFPDGYDARMVSKCIESTLNKAGYFGPLTITVIGHLGHIKNRTPDVLQMIFFTGILLYHTTRDYRDLHCIVESWGDKNTSPATLMLISGDDAHSDEISYTLSVLERMGYTTLLVHPKQANFPVDSKDWLWATLLEDAKEPSREEKICETVKSTWYCSFCMGFEYFLPHQRKYNSFQAFNLHLKSKDHNLKELKIIDRPVSRKLASITLRKERSSEVIEEEEEEYDDYEWDRITV